MATALVAGAVMMGDTLVKFAQGKAGLGDLAFAALGLIPGARGAVSLAKLGRGAAGLARGISAGGGRAVVGALRTGATRTGQTIRSGITTVRDKAVALTKRTVKADPVDVVTGEMVQQQTDVELPGALPLVLTRTHVSSYRVGRWFGPSWASTLDQRLEIDPKGVCYAAEDGMLLVYPTPIPGGDPVLPDEGPRRPLTRTTDGTYRLTDPDTGDTLHFTPDPTDPEVQLLVAISDRNNHRIDFDYNPTGTLTGIRHSGGNYITVDTTRGRITRLRLRGTTHGTDLLRYSYDQHDRLTEVINSSGRPLRFDYDGQGRMTRWTDRNATSCDYTYDATGRCVRTSGSGGCLEATFVYQHDSPLDADSAVTVVTDSLGHTTTFHLNEAGQVIREVDPLGHTTVSEWDRYDRLLGRIDPLGRTARYGYDEAGNLIAVTRPDGTQTVAEYNELGLPVTVTDPDGAVWRREYDERGNLTAVMDPAGAMTGYGYDQYGYLVTVTDALGQVRRVQANAAGLPSAVTNALGVTTYYARDGFGRVSAVIDPVDGVTRFGWTSEGKLAWRTLPDGASERWSYDGEGNLVEHVDALGQVTRTEITHFDLPAARTGPDGARLAFSYDTELRLVAVTNPQGLVWRYGYDPVGNLVRETDFNGRVLAYAHDGAGQLIERTNGAGQTTRYTRDPLGNVVEQRSGELVTAFTYDTAGRLAGAVNADAELLFERDPLGRVVAESCHGRTLTSSFDLLGRRVHRKTPSGAQSRWEFDAGNQPLALRTAGRTVRFGYDAAGREIERHLGASATMAQAWDASHRLRSQTITTAAGDRPASAGQARVVQRRAYRYRADGYLTAIVDQLTGPREFDLDPVGRVTAVRAAGWAERYAYDPAGNVTDATWPVPQRADSPDGDARGEREYAGTLIRRAGHVRYQHDAQGRIIQRQQKRLSAKPRTWHYTWDAEDRLLAVTTPDGQRWQYCYDPLGRRITKQRLTGHNHTVAERIEFTWDGTVLAEQTHTGLPTGPRTTVWDWEPGTFRPITQTERTPLREAPQTWVDEQFYAIITDPIGTPTELLDPDGTLAWRAHTTLWGALLTPTPPGAHTPLRFPGQYHDPETGLNYNYHRYYDPDTARYETNDPLGLVPAPNPHTYVHNPTSWSDPFGLAGCSIHSRYPDGTPVYEGQQPGRISGPDRAANGAPHTVLRWDEANGRVYKAREYGEGGAPIRDIDFTHPTYPNGTLRPDHTAPEQHRWLPNPTGGTPQRGPGEPLELP
ncbi:MAG: DUF6531 domain-containing protein [Pseudonocardiales bacterium]